MPSLTSSCARTYTAAARRLHTSVTHQNAYQPPPAPIPASDALAAVSGSPSPVQGTLGLQPGDHAQGHELASTQGQEQGQTGGRRVTLAEEMGRREVEEWKRNLRRVREWRRTQGKISESISEAERSRAS